MTTWSCGDDRKLRRGRDSNPRAFRLPAFQAGALGHYATSPGSFVLLENYRVYDVRIERTTECPTAVVKANTTWREFSALWRTMLDEVWTFLRETPALRTDGHNVMLYRRGLPGVEVAVEVGVQVTVAFTARGRVVPSTLPAAATATTVHTGAPADIGAAHAAVRAFCSAQRRDVTGRSWEIYGDPDPKTGHFDVSVYWELA